MIIDNVTFKNKKVISFSFSEFLVNPISYVLIWFKTKKPFYIVTELEKLSSFTDNFLFNSLNSDKSVHAILKRKTRIKNFLFKKEILVLSNYYPFFSLVKRQSNEKQLNNVTRTDVFTTHWLQGFLRCSVVLESHTRCLFWRIFPKPKFKNNSAASKLFTFF